MLYSIFCSNQNVDRLYNTSARMPAPRNDGWRELIGDGRNTFEVCDTCVQSSTVGLSFVQLKDVTNAPQGSRCIICNAQPIEYMTDNELSAHLEADTEQDATAREMYLAVLGLGPRTERTDKFIADNEAANTEMIQLIESLKTKQPKPE